MAKAIRELRGGSRDAVNDEGRGVRFAELVDVAARVFANRGYDRATLQEIADAMGLEKASLYHYIDNKEDLLFSICEDTHAWLAGNIERTEASGGAPLDRVRTFTRNHVIATLADQVKSAVFARDFAALSEARREAITSTRDTYATYLRDLIASAQRDGSVRSDVEPKLAAFSGLAMANDVHRWFSEGKEWTLEAVGSMVADLFVASVAVCDGRRSRGSAIGLLSNAVDRLEALTNELRAGLESA